MLFQQPMNRAIIIHGWEGTPEGHWKPWLKNEIEKKGWKTEIPQMPETMHPKFDQWLSHLTNIIGKPDKNLFLIGHSLGGTIILRYLETIDKKIGGAVLVAAAIESPQPEVQSFFKTSFDWPKIKANCQKFVAINSDNDYFIPIEQGKTLEKNLDAELIIMKNMGHFSSKENLKELPIILEVLK